MEKKNKKQGENEVKVTALAVIEKSGMQDEALSLQQEIERKTAELQRCLAELETKKKLSSNRSTFIRVLDELEKAEDSLLQEESFDTTLFKLKFCACHGYREEEDVFNVGNREIIIEFIHFIRGRVTDKIQDIERKLIA